MLNPYQDDYDDRSNYEEYRYTDQESDDSYRQPPIFGQPPIGVPRPPLYPPIAGPRPPFAPPRPRPPYQPPTPRPPFQPPYQPPTPRPPFQPPYQPPTPRPPLQPPGFPQQPGIPVPPLDAPPTFVPQQPDAFLYAVDPGAIQGCLRKFTYLWLTNRQQFWAYLTFVGRNSVAGYRWTGRNWVYFGTDLRNISSFYCY